MGAPLRVAILANADPTSSRLFQAVCEHPDVDVVGVAFTTTLTKARGYGAGVRELFRTTGFPYFAYMAFRNGVFLAKERLAVALPATQRAWPAFFSLRAWARRRGVPVLDVPDFNAQSFLDALRDRRPDVLITRVNQILRQPLLDAAPGGAWCLHSSALPRYRGIAAEFHSLVQGEREMGFTVMQMERRLDAGPILAQASMPIDARWSLHALIEANVEQGRSLVRATLDALISGRLAALPQAAEGASYYSWPTPADTRAFGRLGRAYIRPGELWRYLTR